MEFTQGARKNGRYQQHDNHDIGKLAQKFFQEGGSCRFFYGVFTKLQGTERGFFLAKSVPGSDFKTGGHFCLSSAMENLIWAHVVCMN